MPKQMNPVVLYYRTRPSEKEASEAAWQQQCAFAKVFREERCDIIGEFTEIETAECDYGWTEWRPELRKALELAAKAGAEHGLCECALLRMEAIGSGDSFTVPLWADQIRDRVRLSWSYGYVNAPWYEFEGDGEDQEDVAEEAFTFEEDIAAPPDAPGGLSVYVDLDHVALRRSAPVYLCNMANETVECGIRHEYTFRSEVVHKSMFVGEFRIETGRCGLFAVFDQGFWWGGPNFWHFEFHGSEEREPKMLMVTGERFKRRWRELIIGRQPPRREACVLGS